MEESKGLSEGNQLSQPTSHNVDESEDSETRGSCLEWEAEEVGHRNAAKPVQQQQHDQRPWW